MSCAHGPAPVNAYCTAANARIAALSDDSESSGDDQIPAQKKSKQPAVQAEEEEREAVDEDDDGEPAEDEYAHYPRTLGSHCADHATDTPWKRYWGTDSSE